MANSIGSLFIDVVARLGTLENDMGKVKAQMASTGAAAKKMGQEAASAFESFKLWNSFQGRGMTGITADMMAFTMALQAVKQEFKYVFDNIEKIPGIPADVVESVNQFKLNLKAARNEVDKWIATSIALFAQFGEAIGNTIGRMVYGNEAADAALKAQVHSLDEIRALNDPAYWEKVRAAQVRLSEARKSEAVASKGVADRIHELFVESRQYEEFAKSKSIDSLARTEAQVKGEAKLVEAMRLLTQLKTTFHQHELQAALENEKSGMDELSQKDRILKLQQLINNELSFANTNPGGVADSATLERMNQHFPQYLAYVRMLREEMKKLRSPTEEFRDTFVSGFGQMADVLTRFATGAKTQMQDVLKSIADSIISTFMKLAIINPILNTLFGGTRGFAILPSLFASVSGKATGGPFTAGQTFIAGENGPELITANTAGTVIPAAATSAMLGKGGSGGGTYYIDARGADEARILQLERVIRSMNATIERRSLATSINTKIRGGSAGAALGR